MLNTVEMSSQEGAWFLLREPMSKKNVIITYIRTVWPLERQKIKKSRQEMDQLEIGDDCTDIWRDNHIEKNEKRPNYLDNVTLAQFTSKYYKNTSDEWLQRTEPHILLY